MDTNQMTTAFWTDTDDVQYFLDIYDLLYLKNKINKTPVLKRAEPADLKKHIDDNTNEADKPLTSDEQ